MKRHATILFSLLFVVSVAPAFASEMPVQREIEKAHWLASQVNPMNPAQLTSIGEAMWQLYARASGETEPSWPAIRPWLVEADRMAGSDAEDWPHASTGSEEAPPSFTMLLVSAGLVGLSVVGTLKPRVR